MRTHHAVDVRNAVHGAFDVAADAAVNVVVAGSVATGADVIERPDTRETEGDHDRFSHYVNKTALTRSAVDGKAVVALCGKKWVPTRDGERFPVCPACKEIYAGLRR